jgi:antitoxin CptB
LSNDTNSIAEELGQPLCERRLRWRCRRGMRELDVMLTRYLDHCFNDAPPSFQQAFARLLEEEDDVLWDWLLGRSVPTEQSVRGIVEQIIALS